MAPETTYLLIGLGNPGREYRDTRHNVGFMLVDRLAVRLNAQGMKVQSKAVVTTTAYQDRKLILAKPQTYMNLSGQSAQGLLNFYKIPMDNMLVAHDDLDIPFGTIRIEVGERCRDAEHPQPGAAGHAERDPLPGLLVREAEVGGDADPARHAAVVDGKTRHLRKSRPGADHGDQRQAGEKGPHQRAIPGSADRFADQSADQTVTPFAASAYSSIWSKFM